MTSKSEVKRISAILGIRGDMGSLADRHMEMIKKAQTNPLKGQFDGDCNVTQCQAPGADWWNRVTRAYYCAGCARRINHANRDLNPPLLAHDPEGQMHSQ